MRWKYRKFAFHDDENAQNDFKTAKEALKALIENS